MKAMPAPRIGRLAATACLSMTTLLALTATAAAAAASPAPAGPRLLAKGVSYTLTSGPLSITAGGHTWHLQLTMTGGNMGHVSGSVTAGFEISTAHLGGTESHQWNMVLIKPSVFTANPPKGTASVNARASLAPVVPELKLSFKPTSHTRLGCANKGGTGTTFTGKLTGSVTLHTGLRGLKLSSAHAVFGKPSTLRVESDCAPPAPCLFASWAAGGAALGTEIFAGGSTAGLPGHQVSFASVAEELQLSVSPIGVSRQDLGLIKIAAPKFSKAAKSLSVRASASGIVTGSALLSHPATIMSATRSCSIGGKKFTEHLQQYVGARFTTGKNGLRARTILTGTIHAPSATAGEFTLVTFKQKK
jgi:hypothetical protein